MEYYNKIKFLVRVILFFEIVIGLFAVVFILKSGSIEGTVFGFFCVFTVIIPQYFVMYMLEKYEQSVNKNIDYAAFQMKKMFAGDKADSDGAKEYYDSGEMNMFADCLEEYKKIFSELTARGKFLNEILISTVMNRELEKFLDDVMTKIINITESNFFVFYLANKTTNKLEIKSSIGFGKSIYSQFDISMGEGFVGQAAIENKMVFIDGIDDDSIYVAKTFLGDIKPKNIIAVPVNAADDENEVLGVFAIGSMRTYSKKHVELLEEIRKYIAYAVINGVYYNKNQRLTNELKFQNQLIQNLNEDLELKIKERTVFLNSILNSIKDYAVISLDMGRNIMLFNDGAVERFGIQREDAMDKNIKEIPAFLPYIMEEGADYIEIALKTGKSSHICNIKDKAGQELLLEIEMFAMSNEYNEIGGVTLVARDMSYIKKLRVSEELEKKMTDIMLEESSKAIVVVKDDGHVEGISRNAEYILGMGRDDVYDKNIWEFFTGQEDVKDFVYRVFNDESHKTLNVTALKSKINVSMKAKLLIDDSVGMRKALIYL